MRIQRNEGMNEKKVIYGRVRPLLTGSSWNVINGPHASVLRNHSTLETDCKVLGS